MFDTIDPQFPYYLCLFVLTVMLRWIRTYRDRPAADAPLTERHDQRARYAFFGFELVNVSAGVFILLSERIPGWTATMLMVYVLLVTLGFSLEDEKFGRRVKVAGHLFISAVVLGITVFAFTGLDRLRPTPDQPSRETAWRVAMPYLDQTLHRHFGVRDNPIMAVWIVTLPADDRERALAIARERFVSDQGPRLFQPGAERTPLNLQLLDSQIVAEAVQR